MTGTTSRGAHIPWQVPDIAVWRHSSPCHQGSLPGGVPRKGGARQSPVLASLRRQYSWSPCSRGLMPGSASPLCPSSIQGSWGGCPCGPRGAAHSPSPGSPWAPQTHACLWAPATYGALPAPPAGSPPAGRRGGRRGCSEPGHGAQVRPGEPAVWAATCTVPGVPENSGICLLPVAFASIQPDPGVPPQRPLRAVTRRRDSRGAWL